MDRYRQLFYLVGINRIGAESPDKNSTAPRMLIHTAAYVRPLILSDVPAFWLTGVRA